MGDILVVQDYCASTALESALLDLKGVKTSKRDVRATVPIFMSHSVSFSGGRTYCFLVFLHFRYEDDEIRPVSVRKHVFTYPVAAGVTR